MKLIYIALLAAVGTASTVQAEPLVDIPAGAVIECSPNPSLKWLNDRVVFKEGKLAAGIVVTCPVSGSQIAPAGSVFVGKVVDGPVTDSYAFQWEMLRFSDGLTVRWDNAKRDQPSALQAENGRLRLTFKDALMAGQAGDLH